jgi:hypothetical protein
VTERYYVVFSSSFRYDAAPCISHETVDQKRTLCGRNVDDAATLEPDSNDLEPDCAVCRRASIRLRGRPQPVIEAQIKCETCVRGHKPSAMQQPCGNHGCECWCNR